MGRPPGHGCVPAPPECEEWLAWLAPRDLSPDTAKRRRSVLRRLAADVDKPLYAITAADLDGWQRRLVSEVSAGTRAQYVRDVALFYAWATRVGHVAVDPAAALMLPRLPTYRPRPVREDDLTVALAAAAGDPRMRAWLLLMAGAGLRGGEVAALRADDVDLDTDPALLTVHGKGRKERVVPLSEPVLDALRPFLDRPGPDGRLWPLAVQTVRRAVADHLRAAGVDATAHQLRHRFATSCYRAGRDVLAVADLLGHSSPVTTRRYAAPDTGAALAAVTAAGLRLVPPEPAGPECILCGLSRRFPAAPGCPPVRPPVLLVDVAEWRLGPQPMCETHIGACDRSADELGEPRPRRWPL
jgi:integrase